MNRQLDGDILFPVNITIPNDALNLTHDVRTVGGRRYFFPIVTTRLIWTSHMLLDIADATDSAFPPMFRRGPEEI